MPKKLLVIESAWDCIHRESRVNREPLCQVPERNASLCVGPEIPGWCPLPSVCECGGTTGLDGEHRECTVLVAPEESDG